MVTFSHYLAKNGLPADLASLLESISDISRDIYAGLQSGLEGKTGSINPTGDQQVAMDVFANDVMVKALSANPAVAFMTSEELAEPVETGRKGYSIVFDPLDGSSLTDVNLAVGTIVGVYKGNGVLGKIGRDQVASMIFVYGPQLTCTVTVGNSVDFFRYDLMQKVFILQHENLRVGESGRIMAPGNIRIAQTESWYFKALEEMAQHGYVLRYSGGMTPDVNQILLKGGGVYMYPGSRQEPEGKLRLVYECAPVALLVERAGGRAIVGTGDAEKRDRNILDIVIREHHQRTPIFIGSASEIEFFRSRAGS